MSSQSQSMPEAAPSRTGRRWRRIIVASLLGLLLGTGAGFGYLYWQMATTLRAALPAWPPKDEEELDPLVGQAIEAERAAVQKHPFTSGTWGRLGMVYFAHAYEAEAAACFVQAEKLDPKEPRWHYLHGVLLSSTDSDTAIQEIERAADLCDATNLVPRVRLGELQLKSNRLDQAEKQFQTVIQKDETNARAHLGLARVYAQRGEVDRSFEHVKFSVDAPIGQRGSHDLLAELYQRRGDQARVEEHQKAAERVQRRVWPDPFVDEAKRLQTGLQKFLEVAATLLLENRVTDAMSLLQKTTREYPKSERAWFLMSRAHARQRDWSAAEKAVRHAIEIAPDYVEGHYFLGVVLAEKRDFRAAIERFLKVIEARPAFAEAYYQLGLCRDKMDDRRGAIDALEMALKCQPGMPQAHRALGEIFIAEGRPLAGVLHLHAVLQAKPDDEKVKELMKVNLARVNLFIAH